MTTNILNIIEQFVRLNPTEKQAFIDILDIKSLKKKDFLVQEGKICHHIYFINNGCLRVFQNNDGLENTLDFIFQNAWYTDFHSSILNLPTNENVQALEKSEVIQIKISDLEELYFKYPVFERMGRLLVTNALVSLIHLKKEVNTQKPEQRYMTILKQQPEIIQRIPQHYIASFLGIQKETLSRIKRRILRQF